MENLRQIFEKVKHIYWNLTDPGYSPAKSSEDIARVEAEQAPAKMAVAAMGLFVVSMICYQSISIASQPDYSGPDRTHNINKDLPVACSPVVQEVISDSNGNLTVTGPSGECLFPTK